MSGSAMSSTYVPWPRRKRGSSFLLTEWPMPPISAGVFGVILCSSFALFRRGVLISLNDVDVAGAAAQIARNGVANLALGRVGIALEEGVPRHQHAGSAIAAL